MEQIKLRSDSVIYPSSHVLWTEIVRHLPQFHCESAVLPDQISTVFEQCILDKRLENILYLYCPLGAIEQWSVNKEHREGGKPLSIDLVKN